MENRTVQLRTLWGREHYDEIVAAVMRATTSVWIATANLKELMVEGRRGRYRSVIEAFDELASRGVELRILHASMPSRPFRDEFDRHPRLVAGGLALRQCPRVHMKVVVIDARMLYMGSANWTGAGLGAKGEGRRNFELGIATSDERMIDEVQARFDAIWRGRECGTCKLRREGCEAPLDLAPPSADVTVVKLRVC